MKKLILVSLLFLSVKGFSQGLVSKVMSRLEIGVQAGANYSNFDKANFSTDYLVGYHGGLTVAYKITDNFLFQEEFLYSQVGAKIKSSYPGVQDLKLNYMTVPFLLKYRSNLGIYAEGGAQFGYKLHEDAAGINGTDFAKKTDISAVGGAGFQTSMGLGIGVRYIYGISKVGNFDSQRINNDFKNASIQASIFYVF